jgi:hypothetical protein
MVPSASAGRVAVGAHGATCQRGCVRAQQRLGEKGEARARGDHGRQAVQIAEYCSCNRIIVERRSKVRGAEVSDVGAILEEVSSVVGQVLEGCRRRNHEERGADTDSGSMTKHRGGCGSRRNMHLKVTAVFEGGGLRAVAGEAAYMYGTA